MRAIQMSEYGGPEVLRLVELPVPEAGDGEVLVRVTRAGLNFADTHRRTNSYLAKDKLPLVPGIEVAGVREDTGERVIALCGSGGYAEYAIAPASLTFPIPDGLDDATALAVLVQGLTAWHLYRTCGRVAPGESVVVHAAAGGVGSLAVQLGHAMGARRVIATASTADKRALALELGADVAVDGSAEGLTERLIEANLGKPVDVVFEMVGGEVFDRSLAALAPFGRLVTYGISSGENNTVRSSDLMRRSRSVVGFWIMHCLGRPALVDEALADLFARVARGELQVVAGPAYPLAQAAQAQTDLAARRTTGKGLAGSHGVRPPNLPIAPANLLTGCRPARKPAERLGSGPHRRDTGDMSSVFSRPRTTRATSDSPRRWIEAEDAMALWRRYNRSGDERLRDRLVLTYAPLVKFIVYRKIGELPASCDVDDLVSAGLEALIRAIDRYDPVKGATLEQFAWTRIHGAVIDELRRSDWAPRSLRRWERDVRRVQGEFHAIHGRAPGETELADCLHMTASDLRQRQRDLVASDVTSLNSLVLAHDGAKVERLDVIASDDEESSPFRASAKQETKDNFRRAFAALGRREREVAVLLYVKNLTLREIGDVLGVSESRVCQIHGELKRTLRSALANDAELVQHVA